MFSKSWEEHLAHVRAVLESLRENGLTAKPIKCVWGASGLEYLGYVVGRGKVSVPKARVQAVRQFLRPVTKKNMRSFGGMILM